MPLVPCKLLPDLWHEDKLIALGEVLTVSLQTYEIKMQTGSTRPIKGPILAKEYIRRHTGEVAR